MSSRLVAVWAAPPPKGAEGALPWGVGWGAGVGGGGGGGWGIRSKHGTVKHGSVTGTIRLKHG